MSNKLDQLEKLLVEFIQELEGDGYEDLTCHIKHKGNYLILEVFDPKGGEQ